MNEEIKKILDYMKEHIKPFNHYSEPTLISKDIILLDYITNLQEENERLLKWWESQYTIVRNDEPVHLDDKAGEYLFSIERQSEELQDRIDKAIEYIETQEDYFYNYPLISRERVLEILKGDSDEE